MISLPSQQQPVMKRISNRQKRMYYAVGLGSIVICCFIWYHFKFVRFEEDATDESFQQSKEIYTKWIVVTTIQEPTESVRILTQLEGGWQVVIVGDKKSPPKWDLPGTIFLDVKKQEKLGYKILRKLPYNSYARKMVGYLYAIQHGAKFIFEIDDDNTLDTSAFTSIFDVTEDPIQALLVKTDQGFYNPLPHFGQSTVWPRGYPLEVLTFPVVREYFVCQMQAPAVQQGVATGNPDVDAIFRLTRSSQSLDIKFDNSAPPVILPKGTYAPYNSQNTLFTWRSFWSLMLPISVSARVTDIYRAYWAQALMTMLGDSVGHYSPTALQIRNPHNLAKDMKDEALIYDTIYEYANFLRQWQCNEKTFFKCVASLSWDLVKAGYWNHEDGEIVDAWLADLENIDYKPPQVQSEPTCVPATVSRIDFIYHPVEHNTSFFHTVEKLPVTDGSLAFSRQAVISFASGTCEVAEASLKNFLPPGDSLPLTYVLLVIGIEARINEILVLEAIYRSTFPHILYCGSVSANEIKASLSSWRVSYTSVGLPFDPVNCVRKAFSVHFNVKGVIYVPDKALLLPNSLTQKSLNSFWVTSNVRSDVFLQSKCNENSVKCLRVGQLSYSTFDQQLNVAQIPNVQLKENARVCLKRILTDETQHGQWILSDVAFYVPTKLKHEFESLSSVFGASSTRAEANGFIALLLSECLFPRTERMAFSNLEDISKGPIFEYVMPFLVSDIATKNSVSPYTRYFCQKLIR